MDLGRGKAYRRTLLNDVPTEAQYLEARNSMQDGRTML
jgi:hypothetical protein